mgnify:CR=1 FL=1
MRDEPAEVDLRVAVWVESVDVRSDFLRSLDDKGKGVEKGEDDCVFEISGSRAESSEGRTEEVREPLVEDLKLFVRVAGNKRDDIPLGSKGTG